MHIRDIAHSIWTVVLLLSESRAIINALDGYMLQIIYTTVFRFKRLNNLVWLLNRGINVTRSTI